MFIIIYFWRKNIKKLNFLYYNKIVTSPLDLEKFIILSIFSCIFFSFFSSNSFFINKFVSIELYKILTFLYNRSIELDKASIIIFSSISSFCLVGSRSFTGGLTILCIPLELSFLY